jgi:hypothetical protein
MADPRDTVRQWLADLLIGTSVGIRIGPTGMVLAVGDIADAILSAPGVEVEVERWAYDSDGDRIEACAPSNYVEPTHTQVVIRLPAEEGTGT